MTKSAATDLALTPLKISKAATIEVISKIEGLAGDCLRKRSRRILMLAGT